MPMVRALPRWPVANYDVLLQKKLPPSTVPLLVLLEPLALTVKSSKLLYRFLSIVSTLPRLERKLEDEVRIIEAIFI